MKIVSLQSVGLGDIEPGIDGRIFTKPVYYEVGEMVAKFGYRLTGNEPKVTEINYQQGDFDAYGFEIYTVHTSDGHTRVLPADKYIAEWGE
ncbi:hypothetical protein [Leuconostoc mesenteroides]|uniref:hypothetical protein n=1 Tax=Leuconostoc mesenteroides TaxID=1245 RepID=UPI002362D96B|nr:hypothetical protein [Leuconostoc mesenteroides]